MKCVCAMEGEERWPNEKGEVLQERREVKQKGRHPKRGRAVKKAAPCRG